MGCLKLACDYQEQGEKNNSFKWRVWVNPESDFLGVVDQQQTGGDPLKENLGKAIPLDEWAERYEGQSYFKIITEAGWKDGMPLGPKARYVINPRDNNVMDMRHVMVVGFGLGNPFGDIIEFGQSLIPSKRPSAYNPQDYYSNDIGNSFAWFYFQYASVTANWTTTFQSWMNKK